MYMQRHKKYIFFALIYQFVQLIFTFLKSDLNKNKIIKQFINN